MDISYLKNLATPIGIIGLGKSGKSAKNLLLACGHNENQILTFDEKDPAAQYSDPQKLIEKNLKTLVVSPGVPLNLDWIQGAKNAGAHITSEISMAASLLTTEKLIGITGSVGKSTVVSLLGEGLSAFSKNYFVGGNIGVPFCEYALSLLNGKQVADWVVLELSSYQLENCANLSLEYSAITFLTANHLERYSDLNHYYKTKMQITSLTKKSCVFNASSADAIRMSKEASCETVLINETLWAQSSLKTQLLKTIFLLGSHNRDNFALACSLAELCTWPAEATLKMSQFHGLPHRLEYVANLEGVDFINDSKATAMDSVLVATKSCLEKISSQGRLFLLLGGKDKNLPWQELAVLKTQEKVMPVFFGGCGLLAKQKSMLEGEYFEKLGSAIEYVIRRSQNQDMVLLSPGGTSLDEFKNFEERGDFFKTLVLSRFEA